MQKYILRDICDKLKFRTFWLFPVCHGTGISTSQTSTYELAFCSKFVLVLWKLSTYIWKFTSFGRSTTVTTFFSCLLLPLKTPVLLKVIRLSQISYILIAAVQLLLPVAIVPAPHRVRARMSQSSYWKSCKPHNSPMSYVFRLRSVVTSSKIVRRVFFPCFHLLCSIGAKIGQRPHSRSEKSHFFSVYYFPRRRMYSLKFW